jgi:phosphatidylglycerophosphatase A
MMTVKEKINLFIATGFGIGLFAPCAPGTFGSIPGVALAYFFAYLPLWAQIPACLVLTILAIGVCEKAESTLGIVDDGRITADEWMLFPIALVGIPVQTLPWWAMAIFFVVVRALDIIKLPPARGLQKLSGGRGIVADDFAANLQALAVNWIIYLIVF